MSVFSQNNQDVSPQASQRSKIDVEAGTRRGDSIEDAPTPSVPPVLRSVPPAPLESAWKFHGVLLLLASVVIVLSGWLSVSGAKRVVIPHANIAVPGLCVYRGALGLDCPGCGLTRSFISLAHGNLSAGWKYNPAGFVLFTVVLLQVPYRTVQLWRLRRGRDELHFRVGYWLPWLLVTALLGQWLL